MKTKTTLNHDQRQVLCLIRERGQLTLAEAVECFGQRIYRNAEAHIGRRLARMVNRGLIVRVKPGVFALPNTSVSGPCPPAGQPQQNQRGGG